MKPKDHKIKKGVCVLMENAGQAAEQVVRMGLDGVQVTTRLVGTATKGLLLGLKKLAVFTVAAIRGTVTSRGAVTWKTMNNSGPTSIIAIKESDVKRFQKKAKSYGMKYCLVSDRRNKTGVSELLVSSADAAKVNRIFDTLGIGFVKIADIETETVDVKKNLDGMEVRDDVETEQAVKNGKFDPDKDKAQEFAERIVPDKNPVEEAGADKNPTEARKESPSGRSSDTVTAVKRPEGTVKGLGWGIADKERSWLDEERTLENRPSVKKELKDISEELKSDKKTDSKDRGLNKTNNHIAPKKKTPVKVKHEAR